MRSSQDSRHTGRLLTWCSAALLVAGSIGFATPALAAQSDTGQAHSAHGQAHAQAGQHRHHQASSHAGHGGSGVSLAKPNGFQAQADPDGMENGGVDQPGGTGGVDTTTQDGNNGSGNDTDCEDDNRGVGVPGHCKHRAVSDSTGASDETPAPEAVQLATETAAQAGQDLATTFGQPAVSAPESASVQVLAPTSSAAYAGAASGMAAAPAATAASVLPNTGAGQSLPGLAMAALGALALGTGLLRRSRSAVRVHS